MTFAGLWNDCFSFLSEEEDGGDYRALVEPTELRLFIHPEASFLNIGIPVADYRGSRFRGFYNREFDKLPDSVKASDDIPF